MLEGFEYPFSSVDPVGGAHIDPPSVAVYETLLRKGPDDTPLPGLAQRWKVAADGLSWRLELRPGAAYHSGERCDAQAVAAALDGCRRGSDADRQLWYWDPVDEVRVLGQATLEFTLHYPYSRLPTLLWGTHTEIHNEARRRELGDAYGRTIADGTGPYRMTSWSTERIDAERVAIDGRGRPDGIGWVSLTDDDSRIAAARSGQLSVLRCPPQELVAELDGHGWTYVEIPQDSNMYLSLNFHRRDLDFDKREMRRAVSDAIDRSRLVERALGGLGVPTVGPVPPHNRYFRDTAQDTTPSAAPERATAALEELAWTVGKDGIRSKDGVRLSLRCVGQDDAVFRAVAASIAADLRTVGVEIRFDYELPFEPFYAAAADEQDAVLSKWLWPDAIEALIGFSASWCDGFPNWQHASVPVLDAAYTRWLQAASETELGVAAHDVQDAFVDQLPYVPLLTAVDTFLIRADAPWYEPRVGLLYPEYLPPQQ